MSHPPKSSDENVRTLQAKVVIISTLIGLGVSGALAWLASNSRVQAVEARSQETEKRLDEHLRTTEGLVGEFRALQRQVASMETTLKGNHELLKEVRDDVKKISTR